MAQEQEERSSNFSEIEEKKDRAEKVDMTTDDAQITNSTSVMLTTVAGMMITQSVMYHSDL